MSLDRWLEPAKIDGPASAYPAYSASGGITAPLNAGYAENAGSVPPISTTDIGLHDDPEERAAIMEYDGGLSREEAEAATGADPVPVNQPPPIPPFLRRVK